MRLRANLHRIFAFFIVVVSIGFTAMQSRASLPNEIAFLYKTVGNNGLFLSGTKQIERNRKKIPSLLSNAVSHGLLLNQFYSDNLQDLIKQRNLSDEQNQLLDRALTFALWQYASELSGGDITEIEFLDVVLSKDFEEKVESLAPDNELYLSLKKRLADLNKQDEFDKVDTAKIYFSRLLKENDEHPDIPLLRARFFDVLDHNDSKLDSVESPESKFNPYIYDADLANAVREFQLSHGLKADGVVGPKTLKYLNRNNEDEKKQIVANMARLRDVEWRNRPSLRIDVDIARYWLKAYEDGAIAFEMPVVVGTKSRQTIKFSTVMTGVRLNPGWTLPPTIKAEDYIPKLRTNPEWITERGVKIYPSWDPNAESVDPTLVDWSLYEDNEIKAMRMYKASGTSNPLGLYRFLMHNRHDIYLHDTPAKYLFDRSMRAKSSGCVRISDPRRVAEFLLKDNPAWTSEKIDEVLESNKTFDVGAKRNIPVYFDYKTVWLDADSKLIMGVDVYDFDNQIYNDIVSYQGETGRNIKALIQNIPIKITSKTNESQNALGDLFNSLF
jgi:murein L,D-transpeptidase YcbB/YkuD